MDENIITSNQLLDKKQEKMREELRAYRFKALDISTTYATAGLRTLIILNSGALGLIPTFIKSFDITSFNKPGLFVSMFFFVLSICAILRSYLYAYTSTRNP